MACIYLFMNARLEKNDKFSTDLTRNTSRNVSESPKIFPYKSNKFSTDLTRNTSRNVSESPKIFPINK